MVDTLLVEAVLASVLAAILGYRMDRGSGVKALGRLTFIIIILTVGFALLVARRDLAQPPELVIGEIAIWSYVIGGTLSYFLSGSLGVLPVQGGTLGAALLCIGITALAGRLNEWVGALALVVIVIGIGTGGVRWFSGKILRGKGVKPLTALWFGLCAASLLGYLAAGRAGTFLITIPAQLLFWGLLYYLSGHTLPIDYEDERAREEHYRDAAFKCLLTFALGTNYPYYVIGDWQTRENHDQEKPEPRVRGNAFMQMLAGPGIVINDCNHVAVISDGFRNRVAPPGLSFTGKYEELYAVVDLRPQLRIDPGIKAETKDGITVKILTFMPHRIGADGKQPELTRSFPYNSKDVENAAFYQTRIEHRWNREQEGEKLAHEEVEQVTWDRLVLSVGPPILKDIILRYTYDELLAPGNPRADIADAFSERTRAAMRPMGIEMVGGGISNIEAPDDVVKKRIEKWQAEWQYKILVQSGYAQSEAYRAKALAWTQAQLRTMYALVRVQQAMEDKGVIEPVLERLLIDAVASLMPEAMRPDKPRDLDELTDMPYDPVDTRPRPYLAAREFNPRMRPKT